MQTAEWTSEYSALEHFKQQKHRGYMVIEEKRSKHLLEYTIQYTLKLNKAARSYAFFVFFF